LLYAHKLAENDSVPVQLTDCIVWYGIVEFNVPLDTVQVISETGALSSDVHLSMTDCICV